MDAEAGGVYLFEYARAQYEEDETNFDYSTVPVSPTHHPSHFTFSPNGIDLLNSRFLIRHICIYGFYAYEQIVNTSMATAY